VLQNALSSLVGLRMVVGIIVGLGDGKMFCSRRQRRRICVRRMTTFAVGEGQGCKGCIRRVRVN